jgi:hypothetical protein
MSWDFISELASVNLAKDKTCSCSCTCSCTCNDSNSMLSRTQAAGTTAGNEFGTGSKNPTQVQALLF